MAFEDSLWHDTAGVDLTPRPPLPGDIEADVAIAGAGYTGLWTAYYLHELDPGLRIAIVEREIAGFGASGRNGGWCSALFPPASSGIARRHGLQAAVAVRRAMHESIAEVGRVAEREGIDADYARGGTISLARNEAQLTRARELVEEERRLTGPVEGLELLSKEEAEEHRAGHAGPRRHLHPELRRRASAEAGARARGAGRGARRLDLRAHPRDRPAARRARDRATAPSARRWWCAPPRATPRACAASGGGSCRCTR